MSFTEEQLEQCVLLKHRMMRLIRESDADVSFSVLMTILLNSVVNEHNKKEDFMDAVSISWDQHSEREEKCDCKEKDVMD